MVKKIKYFPNPLKIIHWNFIRFGDKNIHEFMNCEKFKEPDIGVEY